MLLFFFVWRNFDGKMISMGEVTNVGCWDFSASHGWGKALKRMRWMTKRPLNRPQKIQDRIQIGGGIPGHSLKLPWTMQVWWNKGRDDGPSIFFICTRKLVGQCPSGQNNHHFSMLKTSPNGRWSFASYGWPLVIDFGSYSHMDLMDVAVWSVNM